ncbi:hypothetical protein [Shinella sp. BYT-45]|uniref:hypothetical protein n=1 Tax=Shinella sp. BYT-45 TaxID=3377377 RepID=UPI00397EBC2F
MSGEAPDAERFLALAARLREEDSQLSPIGAGLLAAAHMGIAHDSRTFARLLGLAHALVLRELAALAGRGDLLHIEKRDGRTMRTHYALGDGVKRYAALLA